MDGDEGGQDDGDLGVVSNDENEGRHGHDRGGDDDDDEDTGSKAPGSDEEG